MIFTGLSSESELISIGENIIDIFNAAKIMLLSKGSSYAVAGLFNHAHTQVIQCMFLIKIECLSRVSRDCSS